MGSPTWSSLVCLLTIDRAVGLIHNLGPDLTMTGLCSPDQSILRPFGTLALLARADVNSDIIDLTGQTALSLAQKLGHESHGAILKLLSGDRDSVLSLKRD